MTLSEWFDSDTGRQTALAERTGCSKSHLSHIASGRAQPGLELAVAIERETGGAVRCADLLMARADAPAEAGITE